MWEIFDSTGTTKLGESKFHVTCGDRAMNGVEDCGKRVGDGKYDDPSFLNDWLFEGMVDAASRSAPRPPARFSPPPGPAAAPASGGTGGGRRRRPRGPRCG